MCNNSTVKTPRLHFHILVYPVFNHVSPYYEQFCCLILFKKGKGKFLTLLDAVRDESLFMMHMESCTCSCTIAYVVPSALPIPSDLQFGLNIFHFFPPSNIVYQLKILFNSDS